jgi:hypothetical protein
MAKGKNEAKAKDADVALTDAGKAFGKAYQREWNLMTDEARFPSAGRTSRF